MRFVFGILLGTGVVSMCGFVGCGRAEPDEGIESDQRPAAEVGLRLSDEARNSIGLVTGRVERQPVQAIFATTGWLIVKPGNEVVVKAAVSGFVVPETGNQPTELGAAVSTAGRLGTLRIFVSPLEEAQLVTLKEDTDVLIRQSLVSLRTAEDRYKHVQELASTGTVSGKEAAALKAAIDRSRAAYEEAHDKLPFLPSEPYQRPLQLKAVAIRSPLAGRVMEVHVRPRQFVVQGDPLWTVADWSSLWLRVPVFEGDLPRIEQDNPVELTIPGMESVISATSTGIPQPTREGRRTVDLLYAVSNSSGRLRPGQAVSVALPTGESTERLVVPGSAIVWDDVGNAWVYLEEDQNRFRRRRVHVARPLGDRVIIEEGLAVGQSVVTVGAEALSGEEFKSQIPTEDDDD